MEPMIASRPRARARSTMRGERSSANHVDVEVALQPLREVAGATTDVENAGRRAFRHRPAGRVLDERAVERGPGGQPAREEPLLRRIFAPNRFGIVDTRWSGLG